MPLNVNIVDLSELGGVGWIGRCLGREELIFEPCRVEIIAALDGAGRSRADLHRPRRGIVLDRRFRSGSAPETSVVKLGRLAPQPPRLTVAKTIRHSLAVFIRIVPPNPPSNGSGWAARQR